MENEETKTGDANPQEQSKETPLFRQEALQHKKGSYFGNAFIITPISFSVWTLGFSLIAIALALFLYFGKYTEQKPAFGMLVPNKGLITVYAKDNPGIITDKFVQQGDKVTKEQLLYLVSTDQHDLSERSVTAQQVELLEKQIAIQKNKLAISEKNLARYKPLLAQHFLSETDYQKYNDEYLNNKIHLHELEQSLNKTKSAGNYAVRSPADGTIATLVAMVGDRVTVNKPLASIIPEGAVLQGMLFVPTSAIGFVKVGQKVLLKYDAYPYQSFGLYESTVDSIDKSILSPKEIDAPIALAQQNTPFYRVIVNLKQQTVTVYGKPYPLTAGMTLQGSMLGDKRNIWQWIMSPIYSLRGSLTSS